jgi:hemolysin activation/secretion protein
LQLSYPLRSTRRGYDPNAVIGTRGFVGAQEVWSPSFSLLGDKGIPGVADRAQIGAFIEAGQVGNADRLAAERTWTRTAAAGLSALWSAGPYVQLRADYGWQLRALPNQSRGSLGSVSITVGF